MEYERLEPTTTTISKKELPHPAPPLKAPAPTPDQQLLHLQHTIGNRAVQRIIQAKLQVSQPNDVYEREADRIAERVVSMPAPPTAPVAQRQAMPEEEKKEAQPVQTKPTLQRAAGEERADAGVDIEQQLGQSRGKGNPLPDSVRSYMEPRFGADFSGVRIHTGSEAGMLNRSLSAQAFTVGQDIYYGAGKSPSDLSLTAHELTHVVQQTGGLQINPQRVCAACAAGGPPCPKCKGEQQT